MSCSSRKVSIHGNPIGQTELRTLKASEMEKRLLSVAEASQLLGMSESFLYKLAESKAIPHLRLGRAVRFDVSQIDTWLRKQSVAEVDYTDKLRRGK